MKKVLVIAGPTASGKTSFSLEMARLLHGRIISGDSIQVYRGLDIGSGKVTKEERGDIPHELIDILDPDGPYSACEFQKMARPLIEEQDPFPIIAGGTGYYLKACLYDYTFEAEEGDSPADPELEQLDSEELYAMLVKQDPIQAQKIHPHNRRRILRTLTILKRTGHRQSEVEQNQKHEPIYDVFIAGCTMDRDVLYERINQRVEQMFRDGLEEEVKGLLEKGYTFDDPGMRGIGYQEFREYFDGSMSLEETKELIQKNSRHYAKRQYTWLNHQMPVHWFNSLEETERSRMKEEILDWRRTDEK